MLMDTKTEVIPPPSTGIAALLEAVSLFDNSQTKLSRAIDGTSTQLVNNWIRRNSVPAEWCPNIEEATAKRGKRITCERLRPDVRWHVVRALSTRTVKRLATQDRVAH